MKRYLACALIAAALSSCLALQKEKPPGAPLPPGAFFPGQTLEMRSPNSRGWFLVNAEGGRMEFARLGDQRGESYAAQVLGFRPPASDDGETLRAFVKGGFERDTPKSRFEVLTSEFAVDPSRGYPCVRAAHTTADKKAGDGETVLLEAVSLYCKHPRQKDFGFAIIYSHRGPELDPNLAGEAAEFIQSVRVPDYP